LASCSSSDRRGAPLPDPRDQRHKAPLRRKINHVFAATISKEEHAARSNFGGLG